MGLALSCLVWRSAGAAPEVRVRARTRIVIERVIPRADGVAVRGRIVEPATAHGLADVSLSLTIGQQTQRLTSDAAGDFEARFVDLDGRQVLTGEVPGDGTHVETLMPPMPFTVEKPTPEIALSVPERIDASGTLDGAVSVMIDDEPQAVQLAVQVLDDDDQAKTLSTVTTDSRGRALIALPAHSLGHPGERRLIVAFTGNDDLNPTSAEAAVRVMSNTKLVDLETPEDAVGTDENITVKGRLVTDDGDAAEGVDGVTVQLNAGGDAIGEASTGGDGSFTIKTPASTFAPGPLTLGLEYVSTTAWRRGTRAPPIHVDVAPARAVPVRYTLGAVLLTALVVVGFWFGRERPWIRWRAWWAARRPARRAQASGTLPRQAGQDQVAPRGGIELGRARMMSGLRRASDETLSGVVSDAITGQPVAEAMIEAEASSGHAALATVTGVEGGFAITLPPALWTVTVRAPGYVREQFAAQIPHRGELREVAVTLIPVREQVFVIYRKAALLRLPRPELWGIWTPRELLTHLREHHAAGAMGELTALVEEAYFSARVPDEAILPEVERLAQAARIEGPLPGLP
jgi:hypothetical protein